MSDHSEEIERIEVLFKRYQPSLCNLAYNMVLDKDAAKDIVQDVFIKLWENRDSLEFGPAMKGYLFKATAHLSLNYLEKGRRTGKIKEEIKLNSTDLTEDNERLEVKEMQLKVREAIDNLPPKCKVIYQLSRQEGLSYKQIAEHLEISIKTVENQMGIALEKLRTSLKPFLTREFLEFSIIVLIANMLIKLCF